MLLGIIVLTTSPEITVRTSGFGTTPINGVTYGNGLYVAVGNSGVLTTSPEVTAVTRFGLHYQDNSGNVGHGINNITRRYNLDCQNLGFGPINGNRGLCSGIY